jgi:hypothetical protein
MKNNEFSLYGEKIDETKTIKISVSNDLKKTQLEKILNFVFFNNIEIESDKIIYRINDNEYYKRKLTVEENIFSMTKVYNVTSDNIDQFVSNPEHINENMKMFLGI